MSLAANAVNAFGLKLLKAHTATLSAAPAVDSIPSNVLLSPYSIQTALAMTFAGSDGVTRGEMANTLDYGAAGNDIHASFAALHLALDNSVLSASRMVQPAGKQPGSSSSEPFVLATANRLFGQRGYEFEAPFLKLTEEAYKAPFLTLDFARSLPASIRSINDWVEEQTRRRIQQLIPPNGLDTDTILVLVNALYFKAPWAVEFNESRTKPEVFHVKGDRQMDVPTMVRTGPMGYGERVGFEAVSLPYMGGDFQFLILLPSKSSGLAALEQGLTSEELRTNATLRTREITLHLPRFRLEPPLMRLGPELRALGMKSAFDEPRGSANFLRMAAPKPDHRLKISEVFHKTFAAVDERGTEAAAATAVAMVKTTSLPARRPEPLEVRVDRPFLFAIQHRSTGACLFLGRLVNPR